ncbi:hypothetical protein ACWDPF_27340 [Streptomyces albogriseolus]
MNRCRTEGVKLTQDEVDRLTQLPDGAHMVEDHLLCELEDGHVGPHWALAQSEDRDGETHRYWWLRWSADEREWAHDTACPAEDEELELCMLPEGHVGGHSFS